MNTKLLCLFLATFLVIANCKSSRENKATGNQAQGQAGGTDADNDPEDQADGPDTDVEDQDEDGPDLDSEVESDFDSEFEAADIEDVDDVEEPEVITGNNRNVAQAGRSSGDVAVANQPAAINAAGAPADDFVQSESAVAEAAGKTVGLVIGALSAVVGVTLVAVYALRKNRASQQGLTV